MNYFMQDRNLVPIVQVRNVLVSTSIFIENFCCDLDACRGICCVEGDAGAPVSLDEISNIEDVLDNVWNDLSASAQSVIDKQGIAYTDLDGDIVTSIVNGRDCVFTCYDNSGCCLCSLERSFRLGKTKFVKPISCSLYPIRMKKFSNGLIGLNYDRWQICNSAVLKGNDLKLPVYKFLEEPLTRLFGKEWYAELASIALEVIATQKNRIH